MNLKQLIIGVLLLICLACNYAPKRDGMEIRVACKACVGKDIRIFQHSVIRGKEKNLYQGRFDGSGNMLIKLPNQDTLGVYLKVHQGDSTYFFTYLYLQSNTHIDVDFQKKGTRFSGDLALINTYMDDLRKIDDKRSDYKNVWPIKNDRIKSKDSLETYLAGIKLFGADFDKKISSDASLSNYERDLLHSLNTGFETYRRLDFDFFKLLEDRQLYYDNEDSEQINKYQDSVTHAYFSGLTINPHLLKVKGRYYNSYLNIGGRMPELMKSYYKQYEDYRVSYDYLKTTVRSNASLAPHLDFVMSNLIASGYVLDGVAYEEMYELISAFRKDYPHSKYLSELEEILGEYATLKPGTPMKDFTMSDKNGKTFRLSDYKGKLIYVDVWATWCGPCVEEFLYSKKLVERYRKHKDLVFLFLSKDNNLKSWKNFLLKNPALRGVHAIQPTKKDDYDHLNIDSNNVMRLYKINGLPRYILIGKDGRIINYNAVSPSELVKNKYLDSLLTI